MQSRLVNRHAIRKLFSAELSKMYRDEVPAYASLVSLVERVNTYSLSADTNANVKEILPQLSFERHGAIRLGTAEELSLMRRVFAVMGMVPVGYYDLSVAGIPVHSTAFRPVNAEALSRNPFRVFTSLLRLDLIEDAVLSTQVEAILKQRKIFTPDALDLLEKAERDSGLTKDDANNFVMSVLETFRWRFKANVSYEMYEALNKTHRLIADTVSFKGPHINHLTPRTLNIDEVHRQMPQNGMPAKAVIEGPPPRVCPILLRQTSFKALDEGIEFECGQQGFHTARFGEVEQRGIALTPKGQKLYDRLLREAMDSVPLNVDGSNADEYAKNLALTFANFPDRWEDIYEQGLGYFEYIYKELETVPADSISEKSDIDELIRAGLINYKPIIYQDFLPVSAAGIFKSNLGKPQLSLTTGESKKADFEAALGAEVLDQFEHYQAIQDASLQICLEALSGVNA